MQSAKADFVSLQPGFLIRSSNPVTRSSNPGCRFRAYTSTHTAPSSTFAG